MSTWRTGTARQLPALVLKLIAVIGMLISLPAAVAQTSADEWQRLRGAAVQLFLKGDSAGAASAGAQAAKLSSDRFGVGDWRAVADRLRLGYYSGGTVQDTSGQARGGGNQELAGDIASFFSSIRAAGSRDLQRPGLTPEPNVSAFGPSASPAASARIALVIGNDNYRNPGVPPLNNAVKDARAIGDQLVKAGFLVLPVENADFDGMTAAINAFITRLGPDSVALVYYSGHAYQSQNENFLIPVDFRVSDETQAGKESYSLSRLHAAMVNSGAAVQVIILDACRNNAFSSAPAEWFRLAPMPLARNSVIAFSTEAGRRASDGKQDDANGPYAKRLLAVMATPGLEIRDLFKRVKTGVMADTASEKEQQVPWSEEDLRQDFYFYPPRLRWNARDGQEYVFLPKGEFLMGCVPGDKECFPDEQPQHRVNLASDLWIGRTEVTVGAYKLFSDATKRKMPEAISSVNDQWRDVSHPIVKISWSDADAFCTWTGGRLPTEAEWEYSARAGQAGRTYADSLESKWRFTRPAAESASNAFGVVGTAENVEEWVADRYGRTYYGEGDPTNHHQTDPQGPPSGAERVVRGGSWAGARRLSARIGTNPDVATSSRGFRCVLPDDGRLQDGRLQ